MAENIAPHLKTPIFIMNSAYDAYQLPNILKSSCSLDLSKPNGCNATQLAAVQHYHTLVGTRVAAAVAANGASAPSGAFIDNCWVHEQNVDYCHNQGNPNCVGWSPLEPGSQKWGYKTAVFVDRFQKSFTPAEAFASYYESRKAGKLPAKCSGAGAEEEVKSKCWAMIDAKTYPTNPTCVFKG